MRNKEWDINTWYKLSESDDSKQYFYVKEIHEDFVLGTFIYLEPTGTHLGITRNSRYYKKDWEKRVEQDEVMDCIKEFNLY